MDAKMSQNTKYEVLEKLRWRYATAGPEHRRKLIDQAVELMGYHRKSAIRALRGRKPSIVQKPGAKGVTGRAAALWAAFGQHDARVGSGL
jgi:hypothetical protein